MRIHVFVKPHARKNSVIKNENQIHNIDSYTVSVQALPIDGQANEAIIETLADYFAIKKRHITMISGQTAKDKFFEIEI